MDSLRAAGMVALKESSADELSGVNSVPDIRPSRWLARWCECTDTKKKGKRKLRNSVLFSFKAPLARGTASASITVYISSISEYLPLSASMWAPSRER